MVLYKYIKRYLIRKDLINKIKSDKHADAIGVLKLQEWKKNVNELYT